MAVIHHADLTPTKIDLLREWLPRQPWAHDVDPGSLERLGSYRYDDPAGEVGVDVQLVADRQAIWHVPLTYRGTPHPGLADALITPMTHSVLGQRWVYDGRSDPVFGNALVAALLGGLQQADLLDPADASQTPRPQTMTVTATAKQADPVASDDIEWSADDTSTQLRVGDITTYLRHRIDESPAPDGVRASLTGVWEGRSDPALLAYVLG